MGTNFEVEAPAPVAVGGCRGGGDEVQALVLVPGSGWMRAGFAGDDAPRAVYVTPFHTLYLLYAYVYIFILIY